jgi:hypothetical protein
MVRCFPGHDHASRTASIAQALQETVERQSFSATARVELAQDRVVEAGIDQRQTQGVFLVDPSAYGIGGLPIGQALHELQHRRQSEPPRRFGVFATAGGTGGLVLFTRRFEAAHLKTPAASADMMV